jgi:hypothetical protein
MATQNINNYYFNRLDIRADESSYTDFFLVADEKQYDQEVIYSPYLIGYNDGNRLPISIELSNTGCSQNFSYSYGDYFSGNTIVSLNNYNVNPLNNTCYSAFTGACDVGLTGIDNGLVTEMTGQTLYYSMGIRDDYKFDPLHYDRRFKMRPVTGYTQSPNERFSGITAQTLYNIVTKTGTTIGQYYELYGGYLQGFYKLYGYDYEVLPERMHKGWTVEMMLKPRLYDEYIPSSGQTYLNDIYTENSGTFFFMGARAENKFYHYVDGTSDTFSGYTRVTSGLTNCLGTCSCTNTAITNSDCYSLYPDSAITISQNCQKTTVVQQDHNPENDIFSNALSLRFDGEPSNPHLCVKFLLLTGSCVTTGSCETTGLTFESGYTITEICSTEGIYDVCSTGSTGIEKWVMLDVVFERNITWDECDLLNMGGLGDIRQMHYTATTYNNSISLIGPPATHSGNTYPSKVETIELNRKWLDQRDYRLGKLKFFVNGKLFMTIENFEEIIPRELNDVKEKQIGVPFNMSWGGGTFGLKESLTFSGCSGATGPYIQDPEVMCDNTLSGTSLSGLTTNILLEQNFGGTFMGGISEFRMYVEPLGAAQVQHNYRILKDKFNLFNFNCPSCPSPTPTPTPTITPTITQTPTNTPTPSVTKTNTPTPSVTKTNTPTPSITSTQQPTPSITPTHTITPTPTMTPIPFVPGTAFTFNADYIVLTYAFNDGTDLDTRTRVTTPNIGQSTLSDYIGWCCSSEWPTSGTPILTWGGDNTGTGFESVLINLIEFKSQYSGQNIITIKANAGWYGTVGSNPVYIQATLYKGGTMVADPGNHTFYNNTFTAAYGTQSPGSVITLDLQSNCIDGQDITSLQYNLTTYQGNFI